MQRLIVGHAENKVTFASFCYTLRMKKITSLRIPVLTEEAKTILEGWLKTIRTTNGRATRARIVLALHEG